MLIMRFGMFLGTLLCCYSAEGAGGTTTEPAATPAAEPPAAAPAKAAPAAAAPAAAAPAAPEAPAKEPELSGKTFSGDLPDDPDDVSKYADKDGNITIPYKAFKSRVMRADKASLKKIFGTDDREQILKIKTDYEAMVQEKETERRAKLDELEREREDRRKVEAERDELKRQALDRDEREQVGIVVKELEGHATEHVKAGYMKYALADYRVYLRDELTEEQIDALEPKDIAEWFEAWAKERPEMAKAAKQAEEPATPAPTKVLIGNGPPSKGKPSPPKAGEAPKKLGESSKGDIKRAGYSW